MEFISRLIFITVCAWKCGVMYVCVFVSTDARVPWYACGVTIKQLLGIGPYLPPG